MDLVYDVCHNIAKLEDHVIDGQTKRLLVHRKGATRAFPPGHPESHRNMRRSASRFSFRVIWAGQAGS